MVDHNNRHIWGEGPSPFPKAFEKELALVRDDLKAVLEPDKPLFEYANYVLRLLAWWVAAGVAWIGGDNIADMRWRVVAYTGLAFAGLFGVLLAYRLLMINRAMADAIAWRYHQRGRWGAVIAIIVSMSLMAPFATMILLIWAALARLNPLL